MTGTTKPSHLRIDYQPKKKAGPTLEPLGDGSNRQRTAGDLGEKQIAWLRAKSMIFADAKDRVEATLAHSAEAARQIEGKS